MTSIPDEIKNLNVEQIDFNNHEFLKNLIKLLLNVIESQSQTIEELKKENQLLKDEINRLKGEKGKPKISPNVPEKNEDIQSPSIEKKKNCICLAHAQFTSEHFFKLIKSVLILQSGSSQ